MDEIRTSTIFDVPSDRSQAVSLAATVLSDALRLNTALQTTSRQTAEVLRAYINDLNGRWLHDPERTETVNVTGTVYVSGTAFEGQFCAFDKSHSQTFTHHAVKGIGFFAHEEAVRQEDGTIAINQEIMYVGTLPVYAADGSESWLLCAVSPEAIQLPPEELKLEFEETGELNDKLFSRHFEALTTTISDAGSESEAVDLLRGLALLPGKNADEQAKYSEMLNEVLNELLVFEEHLPYVAEIRGTIGEYDIETNQHLPTIYNHPVKLHLMRPTISAIHTSGSYSLHLSGMEILSDKRGTRHIQVPLGSVLMFESSRHLFRI